MPHISIVPKKNGQAKYILPKIRKKFVPDHGNYTQSGPPPKAKEGKP